MKTIKSHPTWVRGLKHLCCNMTAAHHKSHPTWVRGLKLYTTSGTETGGKSHPTWVRGLKRSILRAYLCVHSRILRGCVD